MQCSKVLKARALTLGIALSLSGQVLAEAPAAAVAPAALSIPSQSLPGALIAFAQQTGVQVLYADPRQKLGAIRSPGASGNLRPEQALTRLLAGTGLVGKFVDTMTVVIQTAPAPVRGDAPPTNEAQGKPAAGAGQTAVNDLAKITVLGSLIPRTQLETASALTVITASDMREQGFTSVADALQHSAFNTGSVNNTSVSAGDVWGQKTLSLFGMDSSYTKFLIDGRPMPSFSSPTIGRTSTELNSNLNSIPIDMVERIEILPGGQSSLYGSDAIAGVINIVLKKNVDLMQVTAGVGAYEDGGGMSHKLSLTDSFQLGPVDLMLGVQYSKADPIWASERRWTRQNYGGGIYPRTPTQIASLYRVFTGDNYLPSANACDGLAGLYGGTVTRVESATGGATCGSNFSSARSGTLTNKDESTSFSLHANYEVSERLTLYADLIDTYQAQAHATQPFAFAQFYDPSQGNLFFLQRSFSSEELGGRDELLNERSYENTYAFTLGAKGALGSRWNYDVGLSLTGESLAVRQVDLLADGVPGSYYADVMGPALGDPSTRMPDYMRVFQPLTPEQYARYSAGASTHSSTRDNVLRGQLTNPTLFSLPGGDAGLALVAEAGYQRWDFRPDALLRDGLISGALAPASGGHRTRWATAAELNMPLTRMLTANISGRYDRYNAQGNAFGRATYSVGLEFRPVDSLLLRAKYGTAFKAPSLINLFEGARSFNASGLDYANCALLGYNGTDIGNCPYQYAYSSFLAHGLTSDDLKPITSRSWSYGVVWSPITYMSLSVDYQHVSIRDEVRLQDFGRLLRDEGQCRQGMLGADTPTCQAALAQIIRDPATGNGLLGRIDEVQFRKINLAEELNNAITANFQYMFEIGRFGRLRTQVAYTNVLDHRQTTYPGDPTIDLLRAPGYSTEFKTRTTASLGWDKGNWSATLYAIRSGPSPNYAATIDNGYTRPLDRKLPVWMIYNGSVSWTPTRALTLSLLINNIGNTAPPSDRTQPGSTNVPFNILNYDPYGRSYYLQASYAFGRSH